MPIRIEIVYQTWDADEPLRIELSPEEYFDPVEPDETYEKDAIPKFNHTWQYLSVPRNRLKWSVERRSGTHDDTTFRTQYINDGMSWMSHRIDPDGYEEIIHYTQLTQQTYHLIRTRKGIGGWSVTVNQITQDEDLSPEKTQDVLSPWTWDDAVTFAGFKVQ